MLLTAVVAAVVAALVYRRFFKALDGSLRLYLLKLTAATRRGSWKPDIVPLEGWDWTAEEPRKFRPYKPVYHMGMGLRADTPSELITIDRGYLDRVNIRRNLLCEHGNMLHGCAAGGEDGVREVYEYLMRQYLPARFPTIFALTDKGRQIRNKVTGRTHPTAMADAEASLRAIGETVEEDMFLVRETAGCHRSVAFICCFPAGFNPSTKLDKVLEDIHGPVPSYERIGPSMERFFGKLQVGKSVKRLNWVIQTHDRLLVPEPHDAPHPGVSETGEIDVEKTFLRVELQTLTRLPITRDILFSFKTYLYPIRQIKEEGSGPDLAAAVEGLRLGNAPGMWAYKAGAQWAKTVCGYLRGED
ncbi:hypothetical protein CDD80_4411 [Ophiocordyceps camponoti-rufipedis]|uniref:DUF3445 domain-containing protein n=1 Tax=Ophiocordyceps camponoti-rufipedis TaxID=2004952 RepID=A0A2C5YYB3_9HYPO|nr:hypothetical protein CDD80_4411 [Ophiocordyceps camponoti-rufipedis]